MPTAKLTHWMVTLIAWLSEATMRCRCCAICPAGISSTTAYDVDVPFMQLERHGWDIHAV